MIRKEDIDALYAKLDVLGTDDMLVLAGSIPSILPETFYSDIMKHLRNRGTRFVVDATNDLLRKSLEYHPFMVKPNNHELGEILASH